MIVRHRAVGVAVELRKLVHILPHGLVVGVENVRTIAVDVDALHLLGVDVACNVAALVNDEALFTCFFCFLCEHGTIKAGADDQVIVLFHRYGPHSSGYFPSAPPFFCDA